ncbi:hypothetical protein [uncultured Vibrio sp.]|uniref:hypothetical protein n=1 Tax=uncultured Vibrio sp. TaxID=114054 RepID=UPI0025D00EA6|nr:hypothetical protein [uncultured Vibrio sp.]
MIKLISIIGMVIVGFAAPQLLQFERKMEFIKFGSEFNKSQCYLEGNTCEVDSYRLELLEGNFDAIDRTTFSLFFQNKPIDSSVLVTSDDRQFGVLMSQKINAFKRSVLIPYCDNNDMDIILVDQERNRGLVINLKR